jgi:DNA repair exonuclease SbcCD ATPase subunit
MSDMPGLFDEEFSQLSPNHIVQIIFDYRFLPTETREFVLQKTDETQFLLKKTTDHIIKIGKNLLEVKAKLPHGMFGPWLQTEFSLSEDTARNFMHVADRFGDESRTVRDFPVSVLYLLAAPSTPQKVVDDAFQRAASGERITKAMAQKLIETEKAREEAEKEAAEARAEMILAQQHLFNVRSDATSKVDELTQQIEDLQAEMDRLTIPEIQIQLKEVLPPEKQAELEELQEKVRVLEDELESEKVSVPAEKQEELALLKESIAKLERDLENEKKAVPLSTQKQLEKQQEEIKNLESMKSFQTERIKKLEEDMRIALLAKEAAENATRVKQSWRIVTNDVHSSLMKLLSQWPTLIDVRSFEEDEWERLANLQSTLRRVLEECDNLHVPLSSASPRMLRPIPSQKAE